MAKTDRGAAGKASSTEDEYFAREDAEKKRKLALSAKKELEAKELKRLKELHWMKCPKCGLDMHEVPFAGLDIDVCFSCGGVFLDKGELGRLVKQEQAGIMSAVLNWFKNEKGK